MCPYCIGCVHPAAVLRSEGKLPISDVIASDLAKANRIAHTGIRHQETLITVMPNGPVNVKEQYLAACAWMEYWLKTKPVVAIDVESSSLDFFRCKFYCTGLAVAEPDNVGISFPHTDLPLLPAAWANRLTDLKRQILADPLIPKAFHNASFDLGVLDKFGFHTRGMIVDTLGLHQLVQPDIPHTLDWVAQTYLDVTSWKATYRGKTPGESYGEVMASRPWELLIYNARDTLYTAQLVPHLVAAIRERGMSGHLMRTVCRYVELAQTMEHLGQPVNRLLRRAKGIEMLKEVIRCKERMASFLGRTDFNPLSSIQMQDILFSPKYAGKPWNLGLEAGKLTPKNEPSVSYKSLIDHLQHPFVEAMASYIEMRQVYAAQYREDMDRERKKLKDLRASADDLGSLPGDDISDHDIDQESGLLSAIEEERLKLEKGKNKDNVIRGGAFERAMIHQSEERSLLYPNWGMYATKTTRANSRPNQQNRRSDKTNPLREDLSWTEAPPGWCFVGGDKANLELRLIAARAGVGRLIQVLNGTIPPSAYGSAEIDPHRYNATQIYGLDDFLRLPTSEQKDVRNVTKNVFYAGIYLAGWRTVWRTCRENKHIPVEMRKKMTKALISKVHKGLFHGTMSEIYEWHTKNLTFVEDNGYLEVPPLGRKRWTPERPPPAAEYANYGIQPVAGEIVNIELLRVNDRIKEKWGDDEGIITQVHDSAAFLVREGHADEALAIFKEEFGNTKISSAFGPVSLPADSACGKTLLDVK